MVKVVSLDKITQGMNRKKSVRSEPCRGQDDGETCKEAWGVAAGNVRGNPDNMTWTLSWGRVSPLSNATEWKVIQGVRNSYQICNMKVNDNFELDGGDKRLNFDGLREKGKKSAS